MNLNFVRSITCVCLCFCSLNAFASDNSIKLEQMLSELKSNTEILKNWSSKNALQTNKLIELSNQSTKSLDDNSQMPNQKNWNEIERLNKKSLILIEATCDTAKGIENIGKMIETQERNRAWRICLEDDECSFKKVNHAYNQKTLELAQNAQENSIKLQNNLQEAIESLNLFTLEAQNSKGLNSSIDALSKVNSMTTNVLISLNSQISKLLELNAEVVKKQSNKEISENTSDQNYLNIKTISSKHFSLELNNKS